jgi:hypothetical protein
VDESTAALGCCVDWLPMTEARRRWHSCSASPGMVGAKVHWLKETAAGTAGSRTRRPHGDGCSSGRGRTEAAVSQRIAVALALHRREPGGARQLGFGRPVTHGEDDDGVRTGGCRPAPFLRAAKRRPAAPPRRANQGTAAGDTVTDRWAPCAGLKWI